MITLKTGDGVATSDGKELGRVKEIGDTCFKINAPRRRDYWLSQAAVERRVGKIALLRLDHEHLDEAQIEAEGHTGAHSHSGRPRGSLALPLGFLFLGSTVLIALRDKERRDKVKARGRETANKMKTVISAPVSSAQRRSEAEENGSYQSSRMGGSDVPDLETLEVGPNGEVMVDTPGADEVGR